MPVRIKRIYAAPAADDGFRVLVDRIWPRGMQKAQAEHRSVAERDRSQSGTAPLVRA